MITHCMRDSWDQIGIYMYKQEVYTYQLAEVSLRVLLALRIRIMLTTFLRDVTVTFLSVTDTYIRTYIRTHIMRIDPGLESSYAHNYYL